MARSASVELARRRREISVRDMAYSTTPPHPSPLPQGEGVLLLASPAWRSLPDPLTPALSLRERGFCWKGEGGSSVGGFS